MRFKCNTWGWYAASSTIFVHIYNTVETDWGAQLYSPIELNKVPIKLAITGSEDRHLFIACNYVKYSLQTATFMP